MLIDHLQYLITNKKLNSYRALALLQLGHTREVLRFASWDQNTSSLISCKVSNEDLRKDNYQLLYTCSTYSEIHKIFDDILRNILEKQNLYVNYKLNFW